MAASKSFPHAACWPATWPAVVPATGRSLLDSDAAAYIALIEGDGVTVSAGQRTAIDAFYRTGKTEGWYSILKRLYLPIWAAAAPNARCLVSGTSGTFAGGVTHAAGYVQGNGTTGYFNVGATPAALGLTLGSATLFFLANQADTPQAVVTHIGCVGDAGATIAAEIIAALGGGLLRGVIGSGADTNGYVDASLASTSQTGIIVAGRSGGVRYLRRRTAAGTSELAAETEPDTGTIPTVRNLYVMARNNVGSPVFFTNARYGAYGAGTGMSSATAANFTAALKTLWETCTGLTLP